MNNRRLLEVLASVNLTQSPSRNRETARIMALLRDYTEQISRTRQTFWRTTIHQCAWSEHVRDASGFFTAL